MYFYNMNTRDNRTIYALQIDALQRTNATMRQQYSMVNDWHNSVKDLKENHERELKKFRIINDEVCVFSNLFS